MKKKKPNKIVHCKNCKNLVSKPKGLFRKSVIRCGLESSPHFSMFYSELTEPDFENDCEFYEEFNQGPKNYNKKKMKKIESRFVRNKKVSNRDIPKKIK
jgi:hypothetical protein